MLHLAASKYKLKEAVEASVMCTRFRKFLVAEYPDMADKWEPIRYEAGKLTVHPLNSTASAELFMRTFQIVEQCQNIDNLREITQIDIQKWKPNQERTF